MEFTLVNVRSNTLDPTANQVTRRNNLCLSERNINIFTAVCHNNGTVVKEAEGVYSCQCESQYTGKYCESGNNYIHIMK